MTVSIKMAPNLIGSSALFLAETTPYDSDPSASSSVSKTASHALQHALPKRGERDYKWQIVWRNVIAFVYLHCGMLYGFYLAVTVVTFKTFLFALLLGFLGAVGITAGAHRLWAHRAYKAKWPMRVFLAVLQTMAFQNHIYEWVRDHRVHHKFTDTDADPHNSSRGFFFSHIGWLMLKKHKDVAIKGKTVDMTDLERDPIVMFQRKYYLYVMPVFCFVIPTLIPWYFWNEPFWVSFYVAAVFRYVLSLNGTWLVNSAAHIWGTKPYDKTISPTNTIAVAIAAFGEGWHNYHHVFPWDYKAAELGNYRTNLTTAFIDFFARIGWAYDLKTATEEMIKKRVLRTGDGTHPLTAAEHAHSHEEAVWGWDDQDMKEEDRADAVIYNKKLD